MNVFNSNASQGRHSNQVNLAVLGLVPPGARKLPDIGCGDGTNGGGLAATGAVVDGMPLSADAANMAGKVWRQVCDHRREVAALRRLAAGRSDVLSA